MSENRLSVGDSEAKAGRNMIMSGRKENSEEYKHVHHLSVMGNFQG